MNPTYSETLFSLIRREFQPLKHAAELLARAAKVSPRTAENYLAGTHAPSGEALFNLLAECKPMADEIFRVIEERRAERGDL